MTSSAQTRANRAKVRRGAGAKTAAGKAKSAKNALRHGLAAPLSAIAAYSDDIERLAKILAGDAAPLQRQECARRVAEAQLDLVRVRRARLRLLGDERASSRPAFATLSTCASNALIGAAASSTTGREPSCDR